MTTSYSIEIQGRDNSEAGQIEINQIGDMIELYCSAEQTDKDGRMRYTDLVLSQTEAARLLAALATTLQGAMINPDNEDDE